MKSINAFGMRFELNDHSEDDGTVTNVYVSENVCGAGRPYVIETDSDFSGILRVSHSCQYCAFVRKHRQLPDEVCMYYPMEYDATMEGE